MPVTCGYVSTQNTCIQPCQLSTHIPGSPTSHHNICTESGWIWGKNSLLMYFLVGFAHGFTTSRARVQGVLRCMLWFDLHKLPNASHLELRAKAILKLSSWVTRQDLGRSRTWILKLPWLTCDCARTAGSTSTQMIPACSSSSARGAEWSNVSYTVAALRSSLWHAQLSRSDSDAATQPRCRLLCPVPQGALETAQEGVRSAAAVALGQQASERPARRGSGPKRCSWHSGAAKLRPGKSAFRSI